jgi:hypothetical protein
MLCSTKSGSAESEIHTIGHFLMCQNNLLLKVFSLTFKIIKVFFHKESNYLIEVGIHL